MDNETFEKQYALAVERRKTADATEPRAASVRHDVESDRLVLELRNGVTVLIPRRLLQGLADAPPEAFADMELVCGGSDIHWNGLDVQFTVPGLVAGIFGTKKWMTELENWSGFSTPPKKASPSSGDDRRGGPSRKIRAS